MLLLVAAYRMPASRIVDGPAWIRTERYDVDFQWSSVDDPLSDSGPLVTAIREQLGLKLEPTRGRFDVLAIDAIERPAPD